jgi:transposase
LIWWINFPAIGQHDAASEEKTMTRRPREVPQPGTEGESGCSCDQASQRPALIELAQDFDVHPNQVKQWRDPLLEGATGVFGEA